MSTKTPLDPVPSDSVPKKTRRTRRRASGGSKLIKSISAIGTIAITIIGLLKK